MTILITGITGFVGSHMADYILTRKHDNIVWGMKRWRSPMDNINHINHNSNRLKLIDGDLRDLSSLMRIMTHVTPRWIFHLASQSYVPYSFDTPVDTLETNIIGTTNLLEAVRLCKSSQCMPTDWNPVIHICSSSEVYGQVDTADIPIKETCPLRPVSPYGVSKVGEDLIASVYYQAYGIRTLRTRMFTHTGPRRGSVFAESSFARQIALMEKGLQAPVLKVGNLDSIRTIAHVEDAVRAYWLLMEKGKPGEVYNIGGKETMSVGEILNRLLGMTDVKPLIEVDPKLKRIVDVTLQVPDSSKFMELTGWEPLYSVEYTLRGLLNYWRSIC